MLTSAKSQLDRSRQAAPQVFERLREDIVSLQLKPGAVLARNELAERFGLSQTPIRDALLRLGEEGLVDIFPQHATVVSRIDIAGAQQAHFLRRAIELELVRELAVDTPAGLVQRLKEQIERQRTLAAAEDFAGFAQADRRFHQLLYEARGVPELQELVTRQSGHVDRLRQLHLPTPGKAGGILRDHAAIVRAIARHDADGAQAALRAHLSGTLNAVEDICARYPEFVVSDR